nr:hypothetical protein [Tanacetum cinerariifolium]
MRRVGKGFLGVETPLFENMLAIRAVDAEEEVQVPAQDDVVQEHVIEEIAIEVVPPTPTSPLPSSPVIPSTPPYQSPSPPPPQTAEEDEENVFNQGRISVDMDQDEGVELVVDQEKDVEVEGRQAYTQAEIYNIDLDHSSKVLIMQEDTEVQKVVEVVTTAKLITEVVTAAATQVAAASAPIPAAKPAAKPKVLKIAAAPATRKRKGVVIRDLEEELHVDTPAETPTVKDKGKGILIEDPKPMKKKDQIEIDAEYAKKLQEELEKEHEEAYKQIDWNDAFDNNTKGFKMEFFKGKTYDQILPIFQARFDANMEFLFKSKEEMEKEDEEIIKSINETPAQKAAKRRKLSEEAQEADNLRGRLEIVPDEDDDVFVEAYKQIDWNADFDLVQAKETQYIKRYHGFKKKPQSESEARKNMISYLKNTNGFKMEFFKGKTINETPAQKAAKRRKLSEEAQEADNLRGRLEIVPDEDDDVFVEAIPLAQKNFDKEDLEALWRIAKEKFSTKKPTNFSDKYLLLTLK